MKHFDVNLTKHVQDLHAENYNPDERNQRISNKLRDITFPESGEST